MTLEEFVNAAGYWLKHSGVDAHNIKVAKTDVRISATCNGKTDAIAIRGRNGLAGFDEGDIANVNALVHRVKMGVAA